jgi:hypothetical protein
MDINYKNFPSKYELYYIKWNGIGFDKDKLISFIKRVKWLKLVSIFSKSKREELKILLEIYNQYNEDTLKGILNNDETTSRWALIEKWARIASIDILLTNSYSRGTFTIISNLPIKDYQLVMKRIEELVKLNREITHQSDDISNDIPGL